MPNCSRNINRKMSDLYESLNRLEKERESKTLSPRSEQRLLETEMKKVRILTVVRRRSEEFNAFFHFSAFRCAGRNRESPSIQRHDDSTLRGPWLLASNATVQTSTVHYYLNFWKNKKTRQNLVVKYSRAWNISVFMHFYLNKPMMITFCIVRFKIRYNLSVINTILRSLDFSTKFCGLTQNTSWAQ